MGLVLCLGLRWCVWVSLRRLVNWTLRRWWSSWLFWEEEGNIVVVGVSLWLGVSILAEIFWVSGTVNHIHIEDNVRVKRNGFTTKRSLSVGSTPSIV